LPPACSRPTPGAIPHPRSNTSASNSSHSAIFKFNHQKVTSSISPSGAHCCPHSPYCVHLIDLTLRHRRWLVYLTNLLLRPRFSPVQAQPAPVSRLAINQLESCTKRSLPETSPPLDELLYPLPSPSAPIESRADCSPVSSIVQSPITHLRVSSLPPTMTSTVQKRSVSSSAILASFQTTP
jgi:hypothetical protein